MKISKRTLIMVLSFVLALSVTAFGTLAYMTDRETVTNNFTIGNVDIIVDEENVDNDPGQDPNNPEPPKRDTENDYKLIPGAVYKKDPTMTVKAGSEECYVRMRVVLNNYFDLKTITGKSGAALLAEFVTIGDDWTIQGEGTPNDTDEYITYEFRYKEKVNAENDDVILQSLFETFTVPGYFTGDDLRKISDLTLNVYGDAIQTESFNSAADAWEAFDNQFGMNNTVIPDLGGDDPADQNEDDIDTPDDETIEP